MGYMNTFLANSQALQKAHTSGTDAVLIVDLPGAVSYTHLTLPTTERV